MSSPTLAIVCRRGRTFAGTLASLILVAAAAVAAPKEPTPDTAAAVKEHRIVAAVNNEQITRDELGRECLRHYGTEVLESLVNRALIVEECKRRGITVSKAEVDAEIDRMATRFGLPVEQWFKMLKQERGIKPAQYASDIIWPTLALRKLAGQRLDISEQELSAEFEAQYGPAVRARIIVADSANEAHKLRAAAVASPEAFGNLAKDHSKDVNSASSKGLIQPIHRHAGNKEIEQAAFSLKDGEVSQVLPLGQQFAVLKRESLLPAADVQLQQVRPRLEEVLRDRKMRNVANDVFRELQSRAQVKNVLNDTAQSMPGVAALVNGQSITLATLAEECIERHGEEVLEGAINRRLLEQAAKKAKITVTAAEIDEEIVRAATTMMKPKADGSPDVAGWLESVTKQQNITVDVYRRDSVWPTVVLKKLVGGKVAVSEEDLKKGFEANYGPRVRCRAIVLGNVRQAQKVWELARATPTADFFGELASQYSVEAGSRALQGRVPPIKKHGGQPLLEREAFVLKPGELSSIIQAGDKYVILLCEGFTDPVDVEMKAVRDLLYEDIHEKKLRMAMADHFNQLQENARIDNFLAGTSRAPKRASGNDLPAGVPQFRQVPGNG